MRVALYARVSTTDKGQDTTNQLIQLREYAERVGWTITREYIDHATGKNSDRQALDRMFADASKRKFDVLLVWALDRLTREGVAKTFEHIRRLSTGGVKFFSYTEEHFRTTGAAGELMLAIAAWIAEQERIRIAERTKAGLARARSKGIQLGRPKGSRLPRERVLALRSEGLSFERIAASLRADGLRISRGSVDRIIRTSTGANG